MCEKRISLFIGFVFVLFFLLVTRIFYFGIIKNEDFYNIAVKQQTSTSTVRKLRGRIYDRNMLPLTDTHSGTGYIDGNGKITNQKTPFSFTTGLRYRKDNLASHIIGYTDGSFKGVSGIEKEFDSYLMSDSTLMAEYTSDALGSPVGQVNLIESKIPKSNVVLTLDFYIQKTAEKIMDKYIKKGAVVIMDVRSSDILACASRPTYNQENPSKSLESDDGEFLNRAFMPYNAGSVFKILTAAAALEKNPYYKYATFYCPGYKDIYSGARFMCHKKEGHGFLNFYDAFANSCNCAFYETGLYTGADKICNLAVKAGFGNCVTDLKTRENSGNIPQNKNFSVNETFNVSIGQGDILITPVQCTLLASTIASGGVKKDANIIKKDSAVNNDADTGVTKKAGKRVMKTSTARIIAGMMREVALSGTASEAGKSTVSIAAKTGSAETGWQKPDGSYMVHGWLCGFFPYENPKYAMTVFCEDGKSGAQSCVKPFVEIAEIIMGL